MPHSFFRQKYKQYGTLTYTVIKSIDSTIKKQTNEQITIYFAMSLLLQNFGAASAMKGCQTTVAAAHSI